MSKLLNISLSSLISLEDNKDRVKFNVKIIKEYINILEINIDDLIIKPLKEIRKIRQFRPERLPRLHGLHGLRRRGGRHAPLDTE